MKLNSIYDNLKEQAIKKMKYDLSKKGYDKTDEYFTRTTEDYYNEFYSLNEDDMHQFLTFHNIVDDIDEWEFYTTDNIGDMIIDTDIELKAKFECEYASINECLEWAKIQEMIKGFCEIGGDIWLIKR